VLDLLIINEKYHLMVKRIQVQKATRQ
jgi:hypothetical protein